MDFEDLKGLIPILIFILTIVIDKSSRRKRKKERGHFPPLPDMDNIPQEEKPQPDFSSAERSTDSGRVYEETPAKEQEKPVPWYVEFPEDKEEKQQERVFKEPAKPEPVTVFKPPVFTVPAVQTARKPLAAVPASKPVKPRFNGRMSRRRVCDGFVMAQILDKPRALKPYTDPY